MLAKSLDVEKPSDDYGTISGSVEVEPVLRTSEPHQDASMALTKKPKKKKARTAAYESSSSIMHLYDDAEPMVAKGKGGAKVDPLLDLVSVNTYLKSNPKKMIVRCAGAEYGCSTTWAAPRWKTRVFGHAVVCGKLDKIDLTLRDCVCNAMAKESLGGRVGKSGSESVIPKAENPVNNHATMATSTLATSIPQSSMLLKQTSIYPLQRKARIAALKDQLDFDVLKLICVGGIAPSKVDLPEWKTMWKHGNPDYEPASCAVLTKSQIPNEAARIEDLQLQHLRTCDNLTITFDGNTTKMPESVYTVHVITPARRVFLVEGDESSEESHTGEKIHEVLRKVSLCTINYFHKDLIDRRHLQVMLRIGPERFGGCSSDNTGNTTSGRTFTRDEFCWLIILPDSCHRMSSLCKDIGAITFFQPVSYLTVFK